jgi:hypothetical protein
VKRYTLDRNLLIRAWRDGVHDAAGGHKCIESYGYTGLDTELADLWREALAAYHAGYHQTKEYLRAA